VNMNTVKKSSKSRQYLDEIVNAHRVSALSSRRLGGIDHESNFKRTVNLDYASSLRRYLSRDQLEELVRDARKIVWPQLNQKPLRLGSVREFSKTFSNLGIVVCPTRFSAERSSYLLGFYVRKTEASGRPLICVNTAHHPAAIGATFVHEMGHHLTSDIFGSKGDEPKFLEDVGYERHLNEPFELVADVLVSLGIYPQPLAETMFSTEGRGWRSRTERGCGFSIFEYLSKQYSLSFGQGLTASRKVQYLAGLLHFTKLREALIKEFDV
jgi:hypothetical protein